MWRRREGVEAGKGVEGKEGHEGGREGFRPMFHRNQYYVFDMCSTSHTRHSCDPCLYIDQQLLTASTSFASYQALSYHTNYARS